MTKYNTGNPVGSADPRDLHDTAQVEDRLVNGDQNSYPDRLGKMRKSWAGMESDFDSSQKERSDRFAEFISRSGYEFAGDYAAGIELTEYNQVVRDSSGELWRVSGSQSLPYTTTGSGLPESGSMSSVGDAALRQDLSGLVSAGRGAALVNGAVLYVNSVDELRQIEGRSDNQQAGVRGGEGRVWLQVYWDAESNLEDDNESVFAVEGVSTGRWIAVEKEHPEISLNIAQAMWSWWANPKFVRHGENAFICFTDNQGGVGIAQYNYKTKNLKRRILSTQYTPDDHNAGSIIANSDGLAVFFGSRRHILDDTKIRYFVSETHDIDDLGEEVAIDGDLRSDYPNVYEMDGRSILFYRNGGTTGDWVSRTNLWPLSSWSSPQTFFDSSTGQNYIMSRRKRSDPGRILIVHSYHPENVSEADIHIAELVRNSSTPWDIEVGGETVANLTSGTGLPLNENSFELAYSAEPGEKTRLFDAHEQSIVFVSFTDETDGEYRYLTKAGGTWQSYPIVAAGKPFCNAPQSYFAGVCIDDNNPFLIYVTREEDGFWYYEKWLSEDLGQSWKKIETLNKSEVIIARPMSEVKSSESKVNPQIGAIHFSGRYNPSNYLDYNTNLESGKKGSISVDAISEYLEVGETATFSAQGFEILLPIKLPKTPCQYKISVSMADIPNVAGPGSLLFKINNQNIPGELRTQIIAGKGTGTDIRFSETGGSFTLTPENNIACCSEITVFYNGPGFVSQCLATTTTQFGDNDYVTVTSSVTWLNTATPWDILGAVSNSKSGVNSPIHASVTRIL